MWSSELVLRGRVGEQAPGEGALGRWAASLTCLWAPPWGQFPGRGHLLQAVILPMTGYREETVLGRLICSQSRVSSLCFHQGSRRGHGGTQTQNRKIRKPKVFLPTASTRAVPSQSCSISVGSTTSPLSVWG